MEPETDRTRRTRAGAPPAAFGSVRRDAGGETVDRATDGRPARPALPTRQAGPGDPWPTRAQRSATRPAAAVPAAGHPAASTPSTTRSRTGGARRNTAEPPPDHRAPRRPPISVPSTSAPSTSAPPTSIPSTSVQSGSAGRWSPASGPEKPDAAADAAPAAEAEIDAATTPRPRRTVLRAALGLLAVVVFGSTAFGWGGQTWLDSAITRVAALDPGSDLIVDADAQQSATNVLIAATGSASAVPGAAAGGATLALAHVPAAGGPLTVLSFPTDLTVDRPACARWSPDTRSYSDQIVLGAAGAPLGSAFEVGGPQCATRTVQQLSGIAITGFLGVDLDRIGSAADALGGLAVCIPRPVTDDVLGAVVTRPGRTTLDSRRAGDYARAAAVAGDPRTDRARIERQQLLLGGVLQAALDGPALLDVAQLGRLRPALAQSLLADNVDLDQMLALGRSLQNLQADGLTFAAVPTEQNPPGSVALRGVDAAELFAAVRSDGPLPAGVGPDGAAALTPAQLRVGVLNGTERTGLAATVADSLGALGYGVGEVGTSEQVTQQTLIRFSPDQAAAASLLASSVPAAASVPDPGTTGVLQLVLGTSFDDVLNPPAATAGGAVASTEPPRAGECG